MQYGDQSLMLAIAYFANDLSHLPSFDGIMVRLGRSL